MLSVGRKLKTEFRLLGEMFRWPVTNKPAAEQAQKEFLGQAWPSPTKQAR
jgi:hypothetical protein